MSTSRSTRALLTVSGLIALVIGASILLAPAQFHATYGTVLGDDANLLSEIRAPGGALLVLGALMLVGVFVNSFAFTSVTIAAAVYLSYGLARIVSVALDGVPAGALLGALAIELAIGAASGITLIRSIGRGARVSTR